MATPSSIMIQIKYGKELCSFDVSVNGMKLDLNFAKLMEKIRMLFNFGSDVMLRLTYVDEYKKDVILFNDDDLLDIGHQQLNPVIITVKRSDSTVFQVNYGNKCRQIHVSVNGMKIDLNFAKLMEKIRMLFNFGSDVMLRLTYVDEYKKDVILFDDDDLLDIGRQQLNPVIITAKRSDSTVFQVNYGNKCRQIHVSVNGMKIDLNFAKLMEKIRMLFNFGSDVMLRLTYVDEYKTDVILFDDDDLLDIGRQQLNPVIITVKRSDSTVFQVNYGKKCRQILVSVNGMKLDLNFAKLMEKIRMLFNIGSDVMLRLTYVDEYKTDVILFDDDDLLDIGRQQLNPLIITVKRAD